MTPFLRWAFAVEENGRIHPNHNFDPDMNNAIHISETIVSSIPLATQSCKFTTTSPFKPPQACH